MNKKNNKLALNKQIVAKLPNMKEIVGGMSETIGPDCNFVANLIGNLVSQLTKGSDCDLKTIGWDDPGRCISKVMDWCHGIE